MAAMEVKPSKEAEAAGEEQSNAKSTALEVDDNEEEAEPDIMIMFAEETSIPGLPRVILAKSKIAKYFWVLVCVSSAIAFGSGMYDLLKRYYMYEKKVTVEMVSEPVPFPQITLCNMRSFDFEVLDKINNVFLKDPTVLSYLNKPTGDAFVDDYVKFVAKLSHIYQWVGDKMENGQENETTEIAQALGEALSRLSLFAEIPVETIKGAGIRLEHYVARCSMGNSKCNLTRDFVEFFNQFYFNCYTYDPAKAYKNKGGSTEQLPWLAPGFDNGVSMVVLTGSGMLKTNEKANIIPGIYDIGSPIAGADGVRVIIHSSDMVPFPLAEGFDVPPGFSVSFGVRPRRNVRIGPPHGDCVSEDPFPKSKRSKPRRPYRQLVCQKECIQQIIKAECGCYDETLIGDVTDIEEDSCIIPLCHSTQHFPKTCVHETSPECFEALKLQYKRIQCAEKRRDRVRLRPWLMEKCECRAACNELVYDVSYSLSRWPASGYQGDSVYNELLINPAGSMFLDRFQTKWPTKFAILDEYFNESKADRIDALRDFARINVYVADPEVIVTQESEDYGVDALVSDIGGQLGMWIGLSVITAAELVELVINIIERKKRLRQKEAAKKASVNS